MWPIGEGKDRGVEMSLGYKQMLAEADAIVQSVSVAEAAAMQDDPQVVMVDIRDPRELERDGMILSLIHI